MTSAGDDGMVVDFFAGSGTTAHAVLALNAEDDGDRRFIMVSNTEATSDQPTKNLCRDVCAERIRRVVAGYNDMPALGGDFAYLRTRRIAPDEALLGLDPAALWTLLQLRHDRPLAPYYPAAPIQWSRPFHGDTEPATLAFVPEPDDAAIAALCAVVDALVVFSPAPGPLREALPAHVRIEAVPDRLLAEFPRHVVGL